jgi:sarcosine oxidase, subunit delta
MNTAPRQYRTDASAHLSVVIPEHATDAEWARVLFYRPNPVGPLVERWVHVHGCGQWFEVVRDTLTHEISESRPLRRTSENDA